MWANGSDTNEREVTMGFEMNADNDNVGFSGRGTVCLCGRAEGGYGAGFNAAGGRDSAIFVGCGTETSGGGRVRKDFIKSIYKSD